MNQPPGINLTIQSLYGILQGLACYASDVVMVVMVVMIIWYGLRMMMAQGDPTAFGKARKGLLYAVIGIAVILGTYTIIATVGNAVAGLDTSNNYTWSVLPLRCSSSF